MVYRRRRKTRSAPRARRSYPRLRRVRHRAGGLVGKLGFGGLMNIKNTGVGVAGLIAARKLNPFGGEYKPEIDMIAAGMITSMAGFNNSDLTTAGAKLGIAHLVDNYLLGGQTLSLGGALGL